MTHVYSVEMKEQLLDPYWGRLNPDKVAEGINAARFNASRLASDARIMFEARRYETSAALAILSIEESGKTSILRELALASDDREAKAIWRRLRSHTAKNAMWIFTELVAKGARHLDQFASLFDESSDHTDVLDKLKQVCLYSDCYGKAHWHKPVGIVSEDLVGHLVKTAGLFAAGREVTAREIQLWTHHMGPVRRRSHGWQRKALANWYAQLQAEGLAPLGENAMANFIWSVERPDCATPQPDV